MCPPPIWIAGVIGTVLEHKWVYHQDSSQGKYADATSECQALGGRLPSVAELHAMFNESHSGGAHYGSFVGLDSYGGSPTNPEYWSNQMFTDIAAYTVMQQFAGPSDEEDPDAPPTEYRIADGWQWTDFASWNVRCVAG